MEAVRDSSPDRNRAGDSVRPPLSRTTQTPPAFGTVPVAPFQPPGALSNSNAPGRHPNLLDRLRETVRTAGIVKRATCQGFRRSLTTHHLEAGHDIRTAQELLAHQDVRITMIHMHVRNRAGEGRAQPGGHTVSPPFQRGLMPIRVRRQAKTTPLRKWPRKFAICG